MQRDRFALQAPRYKTRYPSIYYRLNKAGERRYQIRYLDSAGKEVWKTIGSNEKDALVALNDVRSRKRKGERVVRSKMTVQELGEEYLRQTTHLKPGTLKDYGYAFDHWVVPRLGHLKVSSVTVDEIADFISELRQVHTANTIRNCLKPLAGMFRLAVRRGWVAQNPVHALDRQEKPSGTVRRMRILSSDEIKQLLAVSAEGYRHRNKKGHLGQRLSGAYGLLFLTAIFTGLRKGELLALDWADIGLLNGVIRVREGKTAAASREVVMPDFLVKALAGQMKTEGVVFPFTERNVNRALTEALDRAGLEHIRFHDLRHTFASILIGQGEDVTYVADQMGHASPSTTLKTYAKLFDPKNRRQAARDRMQETFKEVVG